MRNEPLDGVNNEFPKNKIHDQFFPNPDILDISLESLAIL